MNIQETCYFPTVIQARAYYKEYTKTENIAKYVQNKINNKEIIIGTPILKSNQTLILIDNNTRYAICDILLTKQQSSCIIG